MHSLNRGMIIVENKREWDPEPPMLFPKSWWFFSHWCLQCGTWCSGSLGNLLAMQMVGPHPRLTGSEIPEDGLQQCVLIAFQVVLVSTKVWEALLSLMKLCWLECSLNSTLVFVEIWMQLVPHCKGKSAALVGSINSET